MSRRRIYMHVSGDLSVAIEDAPPGKHEDSKVFIEERGRGLDMPLYAATEVATAILGETGLDFSLGRWLRACKGVVGIKDALARGNTAPLNTTIEVAQEENARLRGMVQTLCEQLRGCSGLLPPDINGPALAIALVLVKAETLLG